jgi:hypothetical protein
LDPDHVPVQDDDAPNGRWIRIARRLGAMTRQKL